jgi:hypothetical protein
LKCAKENRADEILVRSDVFELPMNDREELFGQRCLLQSLLAGKPVDQVFRLLFEEK